jgi:hypothetical protein
MIYEYERQLYLKVQTFLFDKSVQDQINLGVGASQD